MRRQLRQLQNLAEYPNITIRIMPFERGLYRRQRLPYWLFEFPDPEDDDIVYVENPRGEYFIGEYFIQEGSPDEEDGGSPIHYMETFRELEKIARREDTMDLLRDAINRLEN